MTWAIAYYAFLAAPAIVWFTNQFFLGNRIHWLLLWLTATVSCYVILLLGVHLLDSQLEADLYKHDVNGDRTFSDAEDTPAMREAMGRLTNDTGRALAPVTGVPFSIFWVTFNYIPLGLVSLAIWRYRSHRGDFDSTDDQDDIAAFETHPDADSDNPYHPPRTSLPLQ
jgi:hypothetical protein